MNFQADLEPALQVLNSGGLILYPTDTIWGIGCDATNAAAVQRIYELKQRPGTKSMIVLLADEKDLLQYVAHPDPGIHDYLKKTKKPTTIVYEGAIGLADNLVGADGTIAIRVIKEQFCRHLIKRFRKPVVSTSANLSGDAAPGCYHEISPVIQKEVEYIVKYRQEEEAKHSPSAVVKWNKDGSITIIRE
jgi:L-threonylcarbamoyladenylate synthase